MNHKPMSAAAKPVPKIEIVVNPLDSRPVVAWADYDFDKTGEIHFSPGTAADMMLIKWWLDFIGNAAADEYMERFNREEKRDTDIDGTSSIDTGDIPF